MMPSQIRKFTAAFPKSIAVRSVLQFVCNKLKFPGNDRSSLRIDDVGCGTAVHDDVMSWKRFLN